MAIPPRLPTISQILEMAEAFGMNLTEDDAASFRGLMAGSIASYARLDELAEPKLPVKYPRVPGYRPPAEETRSTPGTGRPIFARAARAC